METPTALGARRAPLKSRKTRPPSYRVAVRSSPVCRRVRLKQPQSSFAVLFRIHRRPPGSLTPCACVTEEHDPPLPPQRQIGRARAKGCYGDVSPVAAMAPIAAGEIFVADGTLFAARPRSELALADRWPPCAVAATRHIHKNAKPESPPEKRSLSPRAERGRATHRTLPAAR